MCYRERWQTWGRGWKRENRGARRRRRRVRERFCGDSVCTLGWQTFDTSASLLGIGGCFSSAAARPNFRSPRFLPRLVAASPLEAICTEISILPPGALLS
eukprot:663806-Pleurochrysis_carterae.AAC.2